MGKRGPGRGVLNGTSPATSTTPAAAACEAGDDDIEDADDAGDYGLEDGADPVDDGHEAGADRLEDGFDLEGLVSTVGKGGE